MKNSEIPVGLLFQIAENDKAMQYFSNLSDSEKENITSYIQLATTGTESLNRIASVVNHLENNDITFL